MEEIILNKLSYPILSLIVFLPVLGALLIMFLKKARHIRWATLFVTIAAFIAALPLWSHFDKTTYKMQFVELYHWIPSMGINYFIGIDGISVLFIFLTLLLGVLSVLVSFRSIETKVKEFHMSILVMETAILGVFVSLDFLLFYIFWETMLIPMFLLIGVWGGSNRVYAAIKFFLYTLVGSLLMLVGIVVAYFYGGQTLNILALSSVQYPLHIQVWLFMAFFAAFAVKVPMFPVHTWLPDAHTEAPTAGSVILAGVLIKMGAYGFLRFSMPMFPDATVLFAWPILILSIIAIIYGAVICLAQKDFKRLIAYSSVSHMGFVTLGLFALNSQGLEGGILQMVNHGIITGALFLMVGIIYERTHTRVIADYGGIAHAVPWYAGIFMIFTLASIGLPGTNGFIGEFLIILGAFKAHMIIGVLSALGIIIGAAYMLRLYQQVFFEKLNSSYENHPLPDLNLREVITLLPLIVLVFWIGFYPETFLSYMHLSVENLIQQVNAGSGGRHLLAEYIKIFRGAF
ncbi:MAG TPA: NADH-quinone oxidoreductase subunit M [Nitrospirae bacterium]|nr:NADH-quinone oxidoreductase subunit M [bacterium BMS3Abin10]GBE37770.1 NADH-quinone oxidoreductase subunit M [bacterium BMS3Bbin08]HDH50471.1 NADH-quinone oxidoreductase subunit M [Nitrospirota bacterium]HDK82183.1 NADH-quinone oxidoreductase subunit M [Nitrospirota bacterium]